MNKKADHTHLSIFALNLRAIRNFKGWSQERAAGFINIKRATLAAWEEGRSRPRPTEVGAISRLYNIANWVEFVESKDFDPKNLKPSPAAIPAAVLSDLQKHYTEADIKTRLAVNILLELVDLKES